MKEDFLHYLWKFKNFECSNLTTTSRLPITIIQSGQYLEQAGPDFFNAQLIIGNQKWAGNVEIHLKSSDWYVHHHEMDSAYDNVILHVVWEHDVEIYRADNSEIPVLELQQFVAESTIENYDSLRTAKSWIFCEKQLRSLDQFLLNNWLERLFFERLERKSVLVTAFLQQSTSDWEAVLFCLLAKNFGLNTNGDSFLELAQSIPFSIIRKESFEVENLEALFFGMAGLLDLDHQEVYSKDLKLRYAYLTSKYQLVQPIMRPLQFYKHRPDNFPTIRLAQFAMLYHQIANLFSRVVELTTIDGMYDVFRISPSNFWNTHYVLDKQSPFKSKLVSKSFIDLIVLNTIIPIRFAYNQSVGIEDTESLVQIVQSIAPEKNAIIDRFNSFGISAQNAFQTQALLQLKKEYCDKSRCLECQIGIELIKGNSKCNLS